MTSLNVSNLDDVNTDRSPLAQGALAATYLILAVLAFVGNSCVFIINFRWRGGISKFKITSIFLLNLALTDIGIAVGNLPFAFVSICMNKWVFGKMFCIINGFIAIYLPTVSITTVLMITVHRAIVVLYPLKNIVTRKWALFACGVSWAWSLIVPTPPLFGISHYEYSANRGFCRIAWIQTGTDANLGNTYSLISVTVFVIIPLFIITVLNLVLLITSWKLQLTVPQPLVANPRRDSLRRKSTLLADQKAFKTVSLVVGAFIICWLPQVVIVFLGIALKSSTYLPPEFGTFQALLVMANSSMNPFIYTYVNKDFRSRFVQILLCKALSTSRAQHHMYVKNSMRSVASAVDHHDKGSQLL